MYDFIKSPLIVVFFGLKLVNKYEWLLLFGLTFLILGQIWCEKKYAKKILYIERKRIPLFILITLGLFSLSLKALVWYGITPESSNSPYLSTLRLYPLDSLKYFVVKPPLTDWYNTFWMYFFEAGFVGKHFPFVLMVMLLNLLGVFLLGKACNLLKIKKLYSYSVLLLLSLFLTSYERHRGGYTYDHLMFVCSSYFFYSLVNYRFGQKFKELHLSLSLVLIIFQSSIYLLIGPVVVFALTFIEVRKGDELKRGVIRFIKVFTFPVMCVGLLIFKNYYYSGLIGTSSIGGPTLMLAVQKLFDKDKERLREAMVQYSVPDWYLWCFDNYKTPLDPTTGKPYPNWDRNTIAFGICTSMGKPGTDDYPFNFQELADNLRANGYKEIAKTVDLDVKHQKEIPHIRNTLLAEASSLWMVKHGAESIKFVKKVYLNNLSKLTKTFYELQHLFMKEGPYYVENENLRNVESKKLKKILKLPTNLVRRFFILFYPISMLCFLLGLGFVWLKFSREFAVKALIITSPIFLSTYIFNTFSGEENHRYFLQVAPFLIVFVAGFMTILYELGKRGIKKVSF